MKKLILTCLLVLAAAAGRAQEAVVIDGVKYLLDGGKASVMQQSGLTGDIVIPETVRHDKTDYTVTTVQDNAFSGNDITSISLPNTVSVMGDACFGSCSKLVSATLPAGLTSLGSNSFSFCYSLESVTLPDGLTSLGSSCFEGCSKLKSVVLPGGVTTLGSYCFSGCNSLESVTLPDGIQELGYQCFYGCNSLESVALPASLRTIGVSCFDGNSALKSVTFGGSMSALPARCFSGCTSLEAIALPEGVKELGNECFSTCTSLSAVTIPDGVTSLGTGCFSYCMNLTSVALPAGVAYIGSKCFASCSKLKSVVLPDGITALADDCFSYCSALSSVNLPASIQSLGDDCFNYCTSLASITLPLGIQSLGAGSFYGCISLKSILLPRSLSYIGNGSFAHCSYLADVTCQWDTPAEVDAKSNIFGNIYTECRLHVPVGSTSAYMSTEPWSAFKYVVEADGEVVDPVRCATPVITYDDNSLVFSCETEGAEYHYSIMASDAVEDGFSADGRVSIGASYGISVYASAEGYLNSDVVKATLCFINAELNTSGISLTEQRGIVVSTRGGIITISGLADGEQVAVYSLGGVMLSSGRSIAGSVTLNAGGAAGVVIVKTAGSSIKVRLDD